MKTEPRPRSAISDVIKVTTFASLLWCLPLLAATEEQINKRFTVQPGATVVVDVDIGSINVSTNGTAEMVVDVWRKASRNNKSDEAAFLRDNPVKFSQEGSTVTIRCRGKARSGSSWFSFGSNKDEAKYTITVPSRSNAQLQTAGGPISVGDLSGSVKAHTSGGGLHFTRLHGPLDGDTSGGGIGVADCSGTLKIHTSGGGIEVAGGSGSLEGDTSGGSVSVKKFGGSVRVETSGGGITIEEVAGRIEGTTSGGSINAVLSAPIADPVKLETSGGGVTVRVPSDAAFNLDAETSAGRVTSELPVTGAGKTERDHLTGAVNGGGKTVHLSSSAGSIHVIRLDRSVKLETDSK